MKHYRGGAAWVRDSGLVHVGLSVTPEQRDRYRIAAVAGGFRSINRWLAAVADGMAEKILAGDLTANLHNRKRKKTLEK